MKKIQSMKFSRIILTLKKENLNDCWFGRESFFQFNVL